MGKLLAFVPAVLVVAFGFLWWMPETRHSAWVLSDENQPIELLTFLALFSGGLLGLDYVRRLVRAEAAWSLRIFYTVFSLGLLLIAMEEIAWGQWFLGFETPEAIRWRNDQGELTLHNIGGLHGTGDTMRLVFSIGGLIGFGLRRTTLMRGIDPPRAIVPWLVVILLCAGMEDLVDIDAVRWSEDFKTLVQHVMPELTEMLVGIAAFLYIWLNRRRYAPSVRAVEDS